MSPPKTGGHSFSETEQGRRNSIRTSPKRSKTFGIWSIFYWALFSGFSLSYFLFLLLLYFYQLHRFVKRGFLPSLQHVSLPFHVFIPGHTFKLMSQFYVSISQTRNELLLHGVKSQKTLMPAKKKKKKRSKRPDRTELSHEAASSSQVGFRRHVWGRSASARHLETSVLHQAPQVMDFCKAVNTALTQ